MTIAKAKTRTASNRTELDGKWRDAAGEKNPAAKLSWQKVREIRASTDTKDVLAARYRVSVSAVDFVLRRYTWIE